MNKCRICQNEQYNRIHIAREMLFGYRDTFNYIECGKCGCLQIGEIPSNLNKYYPKFYWSNVNIDDVFLGKKSLIKSKFKAIRTDCYLTFNPLLEKLVRLLPKPPLIPISGDWDWVNSFRKTNTNRSSAILDVGCGMGSLLSYLSREGFLNLVGVDPYIDREYKDASVKIFKKHVIDMEQEKFHLIMFHHSFEHMDEPFRILNELHNLLNSKLGSAGSTATFLLTHYK
jgi:SAM-dependent methyltransferase